MTCATPSLMLRRLQIESSVGGSLGQAGHKLVDALDHVLGAQELEMARRLGDRKHLILDTVAEKTVFEMRHTELSDDALFLGAARQEAPNHVDVFHRLSDPGRDR